MIIESSFDGLERDHIESLGLNCIYIDDTNKDILLKDLKYIDAEDTFFKSNEKIQKSKLFDRGLFEGAGLHYGNDILPLLIVDPRYFYPEVYVPIMRKYNVRGLILDASLASFLKRPTAKARVLKSLSFLEEVPFLKLFYLQSQKEVFFEFWDIEDFSPLESLKGLEYLYIPTNDSFIDVDFSLLEHLREIDLQYPKDNKTIFECKKIETARTVYYESDLKLLERWSKLNSFEVYFDKLKNLEGLDKFEHLRKLKGQFTGRFQGFQGVISKSIKSFFFYTEARKSPTTLEGISGLENVEVMEISGLKKLETIADLPMCRHLRELSLEESRIPDDIERILEIKSLRKLKVDYGSDVAKKYPKLKPLIFYEES